MERGVKIGDIIEVVFSQPVLTPDGYEKIGYAYVSKLDVKFGYNGIGFDATYLNPMLTKTCTLGYTPNPCWRVISCSLYGVDFGNVWGKLNNENA